MVTGGMHPCPPSAYAPVLQPNRSTRSELANRNNDHTLRPRNSDPCRRTLAAGQVPNRPTVSGVASYGALGYVPPSTSNNFIFSSL